MGLILDLIRGRENGFRHRRRKALADQKREGGGPKPREQPVDPPLQPRVSHSSVDKPDSAQEDTTTTLPTAQVPPIIDDGNPIDPNNEIREDIHIDIDEQGHNENDDTDADTISSPSADLNVNVTTFPQNAPTFQAPTPPESEQGELGDLEADERSIASSDRSSMSHDSDVWPHRSKFKDAAATSHRREVSPSIKEKVDCRVAVYLCNHFLEAPTLLRVRWLDTKQFRRIRRTIVKLLNKLAKDKCPGPQAPIIYRTSAEVRLLKKTAEGHFRQLDSDTVEHVDQWADRVPKLVAKYGAQHIFKELLLEVVWCFDMVDIEGQDGETLADKVWNAVDSKLVYNWKGHPFLPDTGLDAIFSSDMIRELINRDDSLSKLTSSPNGENADFGERLTGDVYRFASRLLAICIYGQKPLACLHHLMVKSNLRDIDLPLIPPIEGLHDRDLKPLTAAQKTFLVYKFDAAMLRQKMEQGTYEEIPHWKVVPIIHEGDLGEGSFGVVKEVSIHADHHTFEQNTFALKELKSVPTVSKAFDKEHKVFSNLIGVPHDNILVPLAMWRQQNVGTDDNFYMLYPKAKCNLKDFMRRYRKIPTLNKQFVEDWIFQLHNLADALEAIHSLRKRSGLVEDDREHPDSLGIHTGSVRSSLQPQSAERKPQKAGYHHDLKPENILVFDDGTWKISDFGTAGVTQVIYGRGYLEAHDINPGDPIYSPPELAMGKRTARSYDMWCFGCILLEILITMFQDNTGDQLDEVQSADPAPHRLDAFYTERANSVQGVAATAVFWYQNDNDKPALRPPVEERLAMLQRRTKDYDQFDALTELARDMLDVEPSGRPSAEKVSARMRRIWRQVTRNLMMNENFYTVPGSLPQPYVSRPTTEGESQSSSPKTTDNFSNGINSTHTRLLQPPELRRTRRHSAPSSNHVLLDLGNVLSNGADSSYETAVDGTPTTPIIQVHYPDPSKYADRISLGSHDDSDDPERTSTLLSRGVLSRNLP